MEGLLDRIVRPLAERVFFAGLWWGLLGGVLLGVVLVYALQRTRALPVVLPIVLIGLAYMATGGGKTPVPLPLAPDEPPKLPEPKKPDPPPRKPIWPRRGGDLEGVAA